MRSVWFQKILLTIVIILLKTSNCDTESQLPEKVLLINGLKNNLNLSMNIVDSYTNHTNSSTSRGLIDKFKNLPYINSLKDKYAEMKNIISLNFEEYSKLNGELQKTLEIYRKDPEKFYKLLQSLNSTSHYNAQKNSQISRRSDESDSFEKNDDDESMEIIKKEPRQGANIISEALPYASFVILFPILVAQATLVTILFGINLSLFPDRARLEELHQTQLNTLAALAGVPQELVNPPDGDDDGAIDPPLAKNEVSDEDEDIDLATKNLNRIDRRVAKFENNLSSPLRRTYNNFEELVKKFKYLPLSTKLTEISRSLIFWIIGSLIFNYLSHLISSGGGILLLVFTSFIFLFYFYLTSEKNKHFINSVRRSGGTFMSRISELDKASELFFKSLQKYDKV